MGENMMTVGKTTLCETCILEYNMMTVGKTTNKSK